MDNPNIDLYDEDEDDETPFNYNISTYPADFTLEVLHEKWLKDEIIMPDFQRENIWSARQASRLIESFMMGLPIPPIFLYLDEEEKLLVIDGKQRLETVFDFFKKSSGDMQTKRPFKLTNINKKSDYYNKSYEEFSEIDQRKLKRLVLRAVVTEQKHPEDDDTSMYHIFERLNTGGTVLKDQEIRNCIYHGKLNDLLNNLNTYPNWRKIVGNPQINKNKKDVQLILRYMALYHHSDQYRKPIKDFLSRFMNKNKDKNIDDAFLENEEIRFKKTCDNIIKYLGDPPLHKTGSLSAALFDSIFIAFAKNIKVTNPDIKDKFNKLLLDTEFQDCTGKATTDSNIIQKRLKLAEGLFN